MKKRYYISLCFVLAVLLFSADSSAQIFGPVSNENDNNAASSNSGQFNNNDWLSNPRKAPTTQSPAASSGSTREQNAVPVAGQTSTNRSSEQTTNKSSTKTIEINPDYMPQIDRPTMDGVVRGHVSMRPIYSDKEDELKDDKFIFIYMTDFNIKTTMSGRILCSTRFIVMSTLDRKINNISFRLKWPNMETAISFNDVTPNVETYTDYTLIGDGCYFMDRVPNVVVNRCRVRNMTQTECAQKIKWLRKTR